MRLYCELIPVWFNVVVSGAQLKAGEWKKNIFQLFMCVTICTYVGESQIFSKWKKLNIRRPFFIPGFIYRRRSIYFLSCFFFFILFFGWSLNRLPLGTLVLDPSFTPDSVLSWSKCTGFPFAALWDIDSTPARSNASAKSYIRLR